MSEIFWKYNNIFDNTFIEKNNKLIDIKSRKENNFIIYTYKIKKVDHDDDKIYFDNPDLIIFLPRAMSIVTDHDNKIINCLKGIRKFSGFDVLDDNIDNYYSLYNHDKTLDWIKSNQCQIIKVFKVNGKFSILKIFKYNNLKYIIFGSKKNHYITDLNNFENYLKNIDDELIKLIGNDILKNIENIIKLFDNIEEDYSLIGELEYDNISWFGLFKDGVIHDIIKTFKLLKKYNLKNSEYEIFFNPYDSEEYLNKKIINMRCYKNIEGFVLYIKNIKTNEMQLCKIKTTMHMFKNFFHQIWLHNTENLENKFKNRVISTSKYHSLNTDSCIRLTKLFFNFNKWLFDTYDIKKYSEIIYNEMKFNIYWKEFSNYNNENIENYFGKFDKNLYLNI